MATMIRARSVHDRYRLQPGDIIAPGVPVTIHNVSYQGLEEVNPVLHLVEYPTKPLVLNRQQCADLTRVSQGSMTTQWIGRVIFLAVEQQPDGPVIAIRSLVQKEPVVRAAWPRPAEYGKFWSTLLLLVILAAAFGAVYLLEHLDQLR